MASASDIGAGFSNYTGTADLGGGVIESTKIDQQPLQDLAHYAFVYNKAEREAKSKAADDAANELADATAYDLSTAIPKDRTEIRSKYDAMMNWIRENRSQINKTTNPDKWLEFKTRLNAFDTDFKGAKVRNVMYKARMEDISKEKNPQLAALKKDALEREITSTGLDTPIKDEQEYDLAPVDTEGIIKKSDPIITFDVAKFGANKDVVRNYKIVDARKINGLAFNVINGIVDAYPKEGTPEWNAMNEGMKNSVLEARAMQGASGRMEPIKSAEILNSVIPKYMVTEKDANGKDVTRFDQDAFMKGEAGNTIAIGALTAVSDYNKKMKEISDMANSGAFSDKTGKVINFGSGVISANDYLPIDLDKGKIDPVEYMKAKLTASAETYSHSTVLHQTNEDISVTKNAIDVKQLDETVRHNKASEKIQEDQNAIAKQAQQFKENNKSSTTTDQNDALAKAQRIYNSLQSLADKDGVISPAKVRQLNQEQLKYLGSEQVSDDGKTSVYSSLDLSSSGKKGESYAIQLVNGEVKIMRDAKPRDDGRGYMGEWDNTKSTNFNNIANNIINERVKNASGKEVSQYSGGEVTTTTSSSSSGSSSSTERYPLPSGKPRTVKQGNSVFTWNPDTGTYE